MIKNLFDLEKNEKKENKGIYLNIKKENKDSKKNLSKSKEKLIQYPQVINNYDVNVRVNIKKLNDNKINIENMNIGELISRKIESNNKKNKLSKYNLLDKKEFFNKTDNNINFLNFINKSKDNKCNSILNNIDNNISNLNKNRNDIQNEEHYNNIISNLKNEFKQITKGNEINNDNIYKKEKKSENLKNLLNINNINNINSINKKESINNNNINNILNNNKENKIKKYSWNLKSLNNNCKKDTIIKENNYLNNLKDKEITNDNKMKTQNNFYKIPKKYIKINNDFSDLRLTEKNEEKLKADKLTQNLNKRIILINNRKKGNNLNLTDYNLKLNNINEYNNNTMNIKKDENNYLNLTYNNNNNNNNNLYKNNTLINHTNDNKNIMEEYISAYNNHIPKVLNINNNNTSINKTQSFIKQGRNNEKNNIIILRSNQSSIKMQNKTLNNNIQPKLLYLDKRINKIKRKMINEIKQENIFNCNKNEINIKMEKNISFSYINNTNNNNNNKKNEKSSEGLNIINKILNVQRNIIFELKQKLFIINNEIIKKNKEIVSLKNICMKLMWFIKSDNLYFENNKKKIQIQNQIIKENMLLRKLYVNNKNINKNIINKKDINNINNNIKQINVKEDGIFNNVIKSLKEKNNNYNQKVNQERLITFENKERFGTRERDNFNDKKRNKSYERINEKNKKEKINNKNGEIDIIKSNANNFYYSNYINKRINFNRENIDNNIKLGKKIKYITKDKNS